MATTTNVPVFVQALQSSKDSLQIINGPGKYELMTSWVNHVFFEIKLPNGTVEKVEFMMNAIEQEDGSGDNWLLRIAPTNCGFSIPLITAFYSSKRRTGFIGTVADHRHLY